MTIKHLPEPQFLFQNRQLRWWSLGIAGFQVATCVGQEVLHRSPRCKNSRHFSKKEKLNTNYPKQKVVFICICICVEILSTLKLSQQNSAHSIPPQITAIFTHGSIAHKLMLLDLPTTIWLPALSHLTAEFSHIWLTCQKASGICWLLLPWLIDTLSRQLEVFACCSPNWITAKKD